MMRKPSGPAGLHDKLHVREMNVTMRKVDLPARPGPEAVYSARRPRWAVVQFVGR